jgi:hypothetical protein
MTKAAKTEENLTWGQTIVLSAILIYAVIGVCTVAITSWNKINEWYPDLFADINPKSKVAALFDCDNPEVCVIKDNNGGQGYVFIEAAFSTKDGNLVIINGKCISACALFADYARPKVCVTRHAVFGFHRGIIHKWTANQWQKIGYSDVPHSVDLLLWVHKNGGFPETDREEKLLTLAYPETLKFWPECKVNNPPLHKADRIMSNAEILFSPRVTAR